MARPCIPRGFVPPKASSTAADYSLIPTKRPHQRSLRDPPLVYLANGQALTQDPALPTKPGQIGVREPPLVDLPLIANPTARAVNTNEANKDAEVVGALWSESTDHWTPHVSKRNKQAQRWTTTVLPRLILPYMELLWETDKLHLDSNPKDWPCSCGGRGFRMLKIVVVRFARLTEINLEVCDSTSAGEQLVQMGLFPCAPCYPTLAVDIRVLEFVEGLFLHVAPNHRAWCDTVTEFLDNQGYRMRGQDPLRRRFSNAFQWYTSLKLASKEVVDRVLSQCREDLYSSDSGAEATSSDDGDSITFSPGSSRPSSLAGAYEYPPESSPPSSRPTSPLEEALEDQREARQSRSPSPEDDEEPTGKQACFGEKSKILTRPSKYLRSRCPTCYGGWDPSRPNELDFDAIVCIDACFTQKHNKTCGRDPLKKHPETKFISEEELRAAEDYVESIRPSESKSKQGTKANQTASDREEEEGEEDGYEGTMKFYQRIYTLDCQVAHDDRESLKELGEWLARKLTDARGAKIQGQRDMGASGRSEAFLRQQWEEQRTEQTKPLPKKSNALGKKAVQEVMRLRTSLDLLEQKCRELEEVVMSLDVDDWQYDQAVEELPEIKDKLVEARKKLKAKERLLGVKDTQAVRHLQNSPFLREQMKALALKTRLVALLRARKFQRDRLERSFRKNSNEAKLHTQIAQSVKRKDPGIQKVARSYNALVKKLKDMIRRKNCPRHATAPREIPMEKLFALDVDDEIWEDAGLTEEWDRPDLPLWLADDNVRMGIRAMLQHDRAEEEIARLMVERDAMQMWFAEEWAIVLEAIERTTHPDIRFQLDQRKQDLLRLCVVWMLHVGRLTPSSGVPEWGPTEQELAAARRDMKAELLLKEPSRHEHLSDSLWQSGSLEAGEDLDADDDEEEDVYGDEYDEDVNTIETFDIVDDHEPPEEANDD
ncbi:hypothetical protein V5O48_015730 [Marasmius crinis-equi]|uniref:CxC1-like cysteine cluster associated with KDZ transposases domain-containing protein n=1 Tax=Marasmius crinis-equi TaxID=585013 RepID=A0ABR3ETP2_9AGAR